LITGTHSRKLLPKSGRSYENKNFKNWSVTMAELVNVYVREYATLENNVAEVIYSEKKMWYAQKGEGWKNKSVNNDVDEKAVELSEEEKEEKRVESLACSIRRAKKSF
jgi:hypothetical protein